MAVPDYSIKTPAINPTAFADVLQRKQNAEDANARADEERRNGRLQRILAAVQGGQTIASNMMSLAEKRQQLKDQQTASEGQAKVQQVLTSPPPEAPAPMASSSAIPEAGQFKVAPSPEQNQAYQDAIQKRKNDLAAALVQADRKGVSDIVARNMFGAPSKGLAPDFQAKTVLYNGVPKEAVFDPRTSDYTDPITKEKLTGNIQPYNPNMQTPLTDEDRARLKPLAQAVIEGRASPTALVNARGADKEKLSQVAAEIDPSFDLSLSSQRITTRRDFSAAGKSGQALTSLNTVIGHLDTLDQKIDALDNKQIPKYNSVVNYLKKNTGKPEVSGFIATKALVVSEMGKIAQGSGVVTDTERKEFAQAMDNASSKDQAKEVISTWIDLMKSRTEALKANWDQTMPGVKPPVPFINEKSKKLLEKRGYNPDTMEKRDSKPPLDSFFK